MGKPIEIIVPMNVKFIVRSRKEREELMVKISNSDVTEIPARVDIPRAAEITKRGVFITELLSLRASLSSL